MVGFALYGYRNNFGCKKNKTVRPIKKSIKIKLFDLILDGFKYTNKYDEDLFVSLAQYFMQKGYPLQLHINLKGGDEAFHSYFMKALFSKNPFHAENLYINHNKFNLYQFRAQFELFNEVEIKGLNFYRNRACMPIENFRSFEHYKIALLSNYDKFGRTSSSDVLLFSPNSSWKDAVWIISKNLTIEKDRIFYTIEYGCEDDFNDAKNGKSCSSWSYSIYSQVGENYVDFCIRLYNNYDRILRGDETLFEEDPEKNYWKYLTLKETILINQQCQENKNY